MFRKILNRLRIIIKNILRLIKNFKYRYAQRNII